MHSAPSVSYPVGRSRFAGVLLLGCWLAGVLVWAGWSLLAEAWSWRQGLVLALLPACGGLAARFWRRQPTGELHWNGRRWQWPGQEGGDGHVLVHLDLQRHLLLRWHGATGAHWLWAERSALPRQWGELRRAVYSRAEPDAPAIAGAAGA